MSSDPLRERADHLAEQLVAWRRELHRHPELSFEEHRTAAFVAERLRELGLEVKTGVGKTGVFVRGGAVRNVQALSTASRIASGRTSDVLALPLHASLYTVMPMP